MNIANIKQLLDLMKEYNLRLLEIECEKEKYKIELTEGFNNNEITYNIQQNKVIEDEELLKASKAGIIHDTAWEKSITNQNVVKKGDLLYTIEIMKSVQEILAEFDMKILEVLFVPGQIVEYGQPLYRIKRINE